MRVHKFVWLGLGLAAAVLAVALAWAWKTSFKIEEPTLPTAITIQGPPLPEEPAASVPTVATREIPARDWPKHAIWYQIFPERFRNGDPKNDPTAEYSRVPEQVRAKWRITPWSQEWYAMDDWEREIALDAYGRVHHRRGFEPECAQERCDLAAVACVAAADGHGSAACFRPVSRC